MLTPYPLCRGLLRLLIHRVAEDIRNRVNKAQAATQEWIANYMNKHGRKPSNTAVDAYLGDLIEAYFGSNGIHDDIIPDHGFIRQLILKGLNNLK